MIPLSTLDLRWSGPLPVDESFASFIRAHIHTHAHTFLDRAPTRVSSSASFPLGRFGWAIEKDDERIFISHGRYLAPSVRGRFEPVPTRGTETCSSLPCILVCVFLCYRSRFDLIRESVFSLDGLRLGCLGVEASGIIYPPRKIKPRAISETVRTRSGSNALVSVSARSNLLAGDYASSVDGIGTNLKKGNSLQ